MIYQALSESKLHEGNQLQQQPLRQKKSLEIWYMYLYNDNENKLDKIINFCLSIHCMGPNSAHAHFIANLDLHY